jgi:hypothetical protein
MVLPKWMPRHYTISDAPQQTMVSRSDAVISDSLAYVIGYLAPGIVRPRHPGFAAASGLAEKIMKNQ